MVMTADGPVSRLDVAQIGQVEATLVDAANPVVFVDGAALGVDPLRSPPDINADVDLLQRLQAIRSAASVRFGMVDDPARAWEHSPMIPFLVLLFAPSNYPSFTDADRMLDPSEMDLAARVISLNLVHKSINVTVSVATTAAALVPGTLVHAISNGAAASGTLRIGHPSGVVHTGGAARVVAGENHIEWVRLGRTARRIMQGEVLVQPSKLRWLAQLRGA